MEERSLVLIAKSTCGCSSSFRPVKIRTAEQAKATERRIVVVLVRPNLSKADEAYVDLLSDLLANWGDAMGQDS